MNSKGSKKAAALLTTIAAIGTVQAQQEQQEDIQPSAVEEIVVTVQRRETIEWNTPVSLEVIDEEDIARLQPNSLADLVRYHPEISWNQFDDRRGGGSFIIRGLGGNRAIMLMDGARLPDGFGTAGIISGRNSFEPFSMGNLQFLKGPASALYGSDGLAGVVLLNTLSPSGLLQGAEGPVFDIGGGYDSVNDGFRQTLTAAAPAFGGDFLVQVATRQTKETDVQGNGSNFPLDADQRNLLLKWENNNLDNNSFGFLADFWRRDAESDFSADIPAGSPIFDSRADDSAWRWRLGYHHTLTDFAGIDRINWQIDLQQAQVLQDSVDTRRESGATIQDLEEVDINQDVLSASLLLGEQLGNHELLAGIDVVRKSFDRLSYYRDINLETGEIDSFRNFQQYPLRPYPVSDTDLFGIFIQDEMFFLDDRLGLTLGLRYDYFSNDPSPDQYYYNSNPAGIEATKITDDNISPSIGVTYEISNSVLVFGNYTSGFRTPPISQQYINFFSQSRGFPHEGLANPDLASERSDGVEMGLRLRGELGNLEVSAYQTLYEDFLESIVFGRRPNPVPGFPPVARIQYRNLSEVEISGIEMDGELNLSRFLNTDSDWWLTFNYANIEGENNLSDEPITSVSPSQAIFGLRYQAASNNYGGQLNVSLVDEYTQENVGPGRFAPTDYTRIDISAWYDFSYQFSLNFRIDNLLDEQYWNQHVAGSRLSRINADDAAAPGRNFSVSARYQFGM
ncbi:MAG: TonB-dependent receptor [Gammaproteobacteria bacterium]|nr:TonB-dependent receptor [Gammaproteobacteria bacterium]